MIRYGVLCLGLSYACLWFVQLGGDPFRIAALALMVAGLVFVVLDLVVPAPELERVTPIVDGQPDIDNLEVGRLTAGVLRPELVLAATIRPAGEGPYVDGATGTVVVPEQRRPRPYVDPNTTGPIPIVAPLDLDELEPADAAAGRHRVAGD